MKDISSRADQIDVEKCIKNVGGNRFDLVLIAAAKAREIRRHKVGSELRQDVFPNISSLLSIQEGKTGKDYLKRIR